MKQQAKIIDGDGHVFESPTKSMFKRCKRKYASSGSVRRLAKRPRRRFYGAMPRGFTD
jgi:hypothetical protein